MTPTSSLARPMAAGLLTSVVALVLLRDPAPAFVYDAAQYWAGAQAVAEGTDEYTLGGLATRGILTALVYLPAYALASLLGGSMVVGAWAVLAQNAFLVAFIGSVVIPLLLRRAVTIRPLHVGVSTALTSLLLSGFVPYPLMDLPAVVCVALAILLLCEFRWWTALLGGAFLAAAVNLRPAYAVPAVLVLLVVILLRWRRAPFAVLGGAAVLAVQAGYGRAQAGFVSLWPPSTELVTAIQFNYAAYGVRYDTIPLTAEDPRLWHCSPGMAEAVSGQPPPTSSSDLLGVMVDNLPTSALFAVDKVTASLHWSVGTPYALPGEQALRPLGLLVMLVSCAGFVSLVALLRSRADRTAPLALIALVLGVAVTLVGSSPEARFALPIVVAGLAGCLAAVARWLGPGCRWTRPLVIGAVCAALLTCLVAGLGWRALHHDIPRGDLTVEACLRG